MGKMIALVIAGCLLSMPARAEKPGTNSYNGCVLALTNVFRVEDEMNQVNKRYCLRLREQIKDDAPDVFTQFSICAIGIAHTWNKNHGQKEDARLPKNVSDSDNNGLLHDVHGRERGGLRSPLWASER